MSKLLRAVILAICAGLALLPERADAQPYPNRPIRIIVPAARPGIAATAILLLIGTWNEFLFALILGKQHALTLPIGLIGFRTERGDLWELMAAGGLFITLPMFVLSLMVQKHFVGSLTAGSVR